MSNSDLNKYQAAAKVLNAAGEQIAVLLAAPEDELHRLHISQTLKMESDRILLITGAGDLQEGKSTVLGPAKTIGGKPIGKVRTFTEAELYASDDKVFNLKQDVERALDYFGPNANSAGILANIPDLIIRGVAKKAGFKEVTKDNPKEITVEFIDQIKAALHPAQPVETEPSGEPAADGEPTLFTPTAPENETKAPVEETTPTAPAQTEANQSKPESKKGNKGK